MGVGSRIEARLGRARVERELGMVKARAERPSVATSPEVRVSDFRVNAGSIKTPLNPGRLWSGAERVLGSIPRATMKLNTRALAACDRVATGIANFLGIQESTARNLVTSGASALMAVGVMFLSGDPLTGFAGIIPGMARIAGADTKTLIFKGQELHVGDFIAFQSPLIPLPEIQAAVIDVKDGVLEIVSTLIAPFRQGGKFKETDVTSEIVIVYPAEEAIKKESRSWNFSKGQRVRVTVKGGEVMEGNVIAAFDGVIVAQRDDGLYITGGASFFKKVEEDRP